MCSSGMIVKGTLMNFAIALVSSRKVLAPLDAAAKGAITPSMWKWRTDCFIVVFTDAGSRPCKHACKAYA